MDGFSEFAGVKVQDGELHRMLSGWGDSKETHDWYRSFLSNGTAGLAYEKNNTSYTCTGIGEATETDIVISSHICGRTVTVIKQRAFADNKNLTSVEIPNGVTEIKYQAFHNCDSLTSVTIPASVKTIGYSPLGHCNNLMEIIVEEGNTVYWATDGCLYYQPKEGLSLRQYPAGKTETIFTVPSNVKLLGTGCMHGAKNLKIVICSDVTIVYETAFAACSNLKRIDFSNSTKVPKLSNINALYQIPTNLQIKVPADLYEQWRAATNWSNYADKIVTEFTNEV